jgi:Eukaryotic cytochrome b561
MGNRFASLDEYHVLIEGHGVIAAIVFLFIIPASIMIKRFRRDQILARRYHIYLNIVAIFLTTVVFILGWFAVGPNRSLTNPHHGIGLTIYVLMLVQVIGGACVKGILDKRVYRRQPLRAMLHQWLGCTIALLGIAQVPLGLTLYGSPKFTFVLYTLWMTFLLILYFIYSYRSRPDDEALRYSGWGGTVTEGTVIPEKKSSGIGAILAPLAVGGLAAAILGRSRNKREERRESRVEVIPSRSGSRRPSRRRESGSYIEEEEKFEDERRGGGLMGKLLAGAAVLGAGAMAKSWWDRRRNREDEYSAVAPDTPNRRRRRDEESEISAESIDARHTEYGRRGLPRPSRPAPLETVTAISAAEGPPLTPVAPRAAGRSNRHRRNSESSFVSVGTPSKHRDTERGHPVRNSILAGAGLGWLAKKFKDRRDRQEQERLEDIRAQEMEDERRLESERRRGVGNRPPKFTGDGAPPRRHGRRGDISESSEISSDFTESLVEPRRGGAMPPLAAGALGGKIAQSRSGHDITEPIPRPQKEPRSGRTLQDVGSEEYFSAGGRQHKRRSFAKGEAEAAAAGAAVGMAMASDERRRRDQSRGPSFIRPDDAAAAEERRRRSHSRGPSSGRDRGAAAGEEDSRRRSRSRNGHDDSNAPTVSMKMSLPDEKNPNLTLRRLTDDEVATARKARRAARRSRADSVGSISGPETSRYRRDVSASRGAAEAAAEKYVEAGGSMTPLSPPRPAYAAGRPPKDSSYYSGPPPRSGLSVGNPESHETWSGMSPSGTEESPDKRRRRRRAERNQRDATSTMDYT